MARFRRLIHSIFSGYLFLGATALYVLASVPLALHYLSKQEFGLWALVTSVAGYLSLIIDFGMSSSVARLLIDRKDERDLGTYGGFFKTAWLVLSVQGLIIFVAGLCLAPILCSAAGIETGLRNEFIELIRWQALMVALSCCLRIFSQVLQAHQRNDVLNYSLISILVFNLVVLWLCFRAGAGVFSLVWSGLLSSIAGAVLCMLACWRLSLLPGSGRWGKVSWDDFKQLFSYGKDLFLAALGTQLVMASQTFIFTRRLGLEAAAAWSVGTRSFGLVSQAIWRIMLYSGPAISEMMVRGEKQVLRNRFRDLVVLSGSLSAFAAVCFASCNSLFVALWTKLSSKPPIGWSPLNDVLLGLWLIVLSLLNCHSNLVVNSKRIGFLRYIYFIEGAVFVVAAWFLAPLGGFPVVIASSVLCSAACTYAYGVRRTCRYFDFAASEVSGTWLAPMAKVIVFFGSWSLLVWLGTSHLSGFIRLLIAMTSCGTFGLVILLRHGLPGPLRQELIGRSPSFLSPFTRRLLGFARSHSSTETPSAGINP